MANLRAAVTAVKKELETHAERVAALEGVLAELNKLGWVPKSAPIRKRRRMSAAAKKAISIRMRKVWAEKRKAANK